MRSGLRTPGTQSSCLPARGALPADFQGLFDQRDVLGVLATALRGFFVSIDEGWVGEGASLPLPPSSGCDGLSGGDKDRTHTSRFGPSLREREPGLIGRRQFRDAKTHAEHDQK